MTPKLLPIDMAYVTRVLLRLLEIPSPTGRTTQVMQFLRRELEDLGVAPEFTRRGALVGQLRGEHEGLDRAVVVHADTIGCMVKRIKDNGRLQVISVGTHSSRFAEGARVTVLTDDPAVSVTGTVLPLKASGHTFGTQVNSQRTAWDAVEVRLDEFVDTPEDTRALGIDVGDFVAFHPQPEITRAGFVKSRHLDDKAGIAAALGAFKSLLDHEVVLPVNAHLLVTVAEEVGQGASHGIDLDVAEAVAIDIAVAAPGQQSRETDVSVAMSDRTGPFDYDLTRQLLSLCRQLGIPAQRDAYNHYSSDVGSALRAGAEIRGALIGFGVDASHGHERTHLDGIRHVAELVAAYLQTRLVAG